MAGSNWYVPLVLLHNQTNAPIFVPFDNVNGPKVLPILLLFRDGISSTITLLLYHPGLCRVHVLPLFHLLAGVC